MKPLSADTKTLKKSILENQGNLTRAAAFLEVSKQHVMNLVKRFGLTEWARQIRIENGHPPTGNPTSRPRRVKKTESLQTSPIT